MHQAIHQRKLALAAFLESLHRAGFGDASEENVSLRPYRYRKDRRFANGFFQPRPKDGRCDMYIVHATGGMGSASVMRFHHDEYQTWELSPTPIPDSVVWTLGEIACGCIRIFETLCGHTKRLLTHIP